MMKVYEQYPEYVTQQLFSFHIAKHLWLTEYCDVPAKFIVYIFKLIYLGYEQCTVADLVRALSEGRSSEGIYLIALDVLYVVLVLSTSRL